MDAVLFWDMSLAEIMAAIKGYRKREQDSLQLQAIVAYRQAHLLGDIFGQMLSGKGQVPSMRDAFPGVFNGVQMPKLKQQDWRLMKARIDEFRIQQQSAKRR